MNVRAGLGRTCRRSPLFEGFSLDGGDFHFEGFCISVYQNADTKPFCQSFKRHHFKDMFKWFIIGISFGNCVGHRSKVLSTTSRLERRAGNRQSMLWSESFARIVAYISSPSLAPLMMQSATLKIAYFRAHLGLRESCGE